MQSRKRAGCEDVVEMKMCVGAPVTCSDKWTPWTFCDPKTHIRERHNDACELVETEECNLEGVEDICE